jgi:hypothetical protein
VLSHRSGGRSCSRRRGGWRWRRRPDDTRDGYGHAMLCFEMADDRLEGGPAAQLAFDLGCHAPFLAGDEGPELVIGARCGRGIPFRWDTLEGAADHCLHVRDHGCQGVTFMGIAWQRLHMGDEPSVADGGSDGDLDAEFVGPMGHAFADAFDIDERSNTSRCRKNSSPPEVLVVGVLDPALAQHLIGQVIGVMRTASPAISRVGSGGWPASSVQTSPKRPSRNDQSTSPPAHQRMVHVDDLIEPGAKRILLARIPPLPLRINDFRQIKLPKRVSFRFPIKGLGILHGDQKIGVCAQNGLRSGVFQQPNQNGRLVRRNGRNPASRASGSPGHRISSHSTAPQRLGHDTCVKSMVYLSLTIG